MGVPEPATWAIVMLGFGLMGAALRWRGRFQTVLSVADANVAGEHGPNLFHQNRTVS